MLNSSEVKYLMMDRVAAIAGNCEYLVHLLHLDFSK